MLAGGAIEEVAALAARKLDPLLPAMKAHGVPVLIRHIRGEVTLAEAAEFGRTETRQYAKRQFTWFRHQLPEFEWVAPEAARGWLDVSQSDQSSHPECVSYVSEHRSRPSVEPGHDRSREPAMPAFCAVAAFSPSPNGRKPANL